MTPVSVTDFVGTGPLMCVTTLCDVPSFQVTLHGRPGASPLSPLPSHGYQSSLHWNRCCTFRITLYSTGRRVNYDGAGLQNFIVMCNI